MSEECVWLCCHRCATGLLLYVCMILIPTPHSAPSLPSPQFFTIRADLHYGSVSGSFPEGTRLPD